MPHEHEDEHEHEELSAIAEALGALVPSRSRIDRDRLMFQAGQAAGGGRPRSSGRHAWAAIAASCALIALGEAALLARGPRPRVVERVVVVHAPATSTVDLPPGRIPVEALAPATTSTAAPLPPERTARDRLAGQVLRYGLDGLPSSPTARGTPPGPWAAAGSRALLQDELRTILEPGDPS